VQFHLDREHEHRPDGTAGASAIGRDHILVAPLSGRWTSEYGAFVELDDFQTRITSIYGERDRQRGVVSAVAWLAEEMGELAQAVRKGSTDDQRHEIGDVLAWLASLAAQLGIGLNDAADRFANGCPICDGSPCRCP
jgi:NTP pyrophosphatase (non-canonical NTP hydrolase)